MAWNAEKAAQLAKNNRLFIAVWENKETAEKRANVEKFLKNGADVNAPNANFKNNTALHIAIRKADIDIIKLLLEWGADVTRTNSFDEKALDVAKTLKGDVGKEIVTLIEEHIMTKHVPAAEKLAEPVSEDTELDQSAEPLHPNYFLMQDKNTGVRGHLYETKLLSLVLLRAANDKNIEDYHLASNMAGIGVFDDICFKYNVKGRDKSIRLFLQAKHRDLPKKGRLTVEDVLKPDGDLSLANCFDSFLQIKIKLDPKKRDPIFGESYENVELHFIIYTSAEESFNRKLIGRNERSPKIHNLIYTGEKKTIFQFDYKNGDIYNITRDVQRMRIKVLAQNFIKFILGDKDKYKHMLEDDLIKKYHCVLVEIAVRICSVEKNYNEGVFRPELFQTTDTFNVLLKEELCKAIIEHCCIKPSKVDQGIIMEFKQLPKEPSSDALSIFIGTVITYDMKNNKLKALDNIAKRGLKSHDIKQLSEHLELIHANPNVISDAIMKAGKQKLLSTKFKLPPSFGNTDMTIKGKDRITYIASIFEDLFDINKDTEKIIINETDLDKNVKPNTKNTLTEGFLGHNGGIGGAVGNLLLFDKNTKMFKFNTARPQFEKAYDALEKLEKVVPRGKKLDDYQIQVNTYNFPRVAFSDDEYDTALAKCFLNRLWFYTNQGKEDDVEKSVKTEIDKYYNEHRGRKPFGFRTHIDSIFSTFHNELQKWWMVSTNDSLTVYLTSNSDIFRIAQEGVVDSPLLTLHNEMYLSTIKKTGIEFMPNAVENLQLEQFADRLVNIKTDCNTLTAIKIQQHFKNKYTYNFMDFYYMLSLPPEDRNVILEELTQTCVDILIVVCGLPKTDRPINEDLSRIINLFNGNKVIIVTLNVVNSSMNLRIPDKHSTIEDTMNGFINLDEDIRNKFAKEIIITFQDEEVSLEDMLDDTFKKVINAKILSNLIDNERIEIGRTLINKNYEDIKDYYVPRKLRKEDSDILCPVDSLYHLSDKVVLIISKHGTGKSSLLTHIALETKKITPTWWIVRINLSDYSDDFYIWQKERTEINKVNALMFLCQASLNYVNKKTDFQLVERDGEIALDTCDARDGTVLLELELFLHYYNTRKITFLFYGFDYVCPPFDKEVIRLLKVIEADGVTMWIASHLVAIPKQVLENHFGNSYQLQIIDQTGQLGFFYKFWKTNIQLEKINNELLSNILEFLECMYLNTNFHNPNMENRVFMPWLCMPLHILYLFAIDFFQTELSNFSFEHVKSKLKQCLDIDLNRGSTLGSFMDETPEAQQAVELAGTPLHMYVAANYFECKIKERLRIEADVPEIKKKWDLWGDAVQLYERFLQYNMDKVFCQCDALQLDESHEVNKRKEFFDRHKKLALLAICKDEDLSKLLPDDEINDLRNTIARIQNGEERSAFVDCVLEKVPRFFHLMYAEYCAVEILTDILKKVQMDEWRYTLVWDFVVNIFLFSCSKSVRSAFDYKLKEDPQVAELASGERCRNILFELLMKQNGEGSSAANADGRNSLQMAVDTGMNNFIKVLLMTIETQLTAENVKSIVKSLQTLDIFSLVFNIMGGNAPTNITQFFSDMNLDRVTDVLRSDHTVELPLSVLSLFVRPNVVDEARQALNRARQRLVDNAANRFGLSQDNIEQLQRLAETIKRLHSN